MKHDFGLETLLDLDGTIIEQENGYWVKLEAKQNNSPTRERPHGIRYCLSLHDARGKRVMGFDNAHAVKPNKKTSTPSRPTARTYDHKHHNRSDKGAPYSFVNPYQLLEDFFKEVDTILRTLKH